MIATQDAKLKYDPRTDAALDAAEPACQLARELLDDCSASPAERRHKVEKIVAAIVQLALECSRNANDAAKSRVLIRNITGVDPTKKERGLAPAAQRAREEAYVNSLGGDWPKAIDAVRAFGVRFWGTCIAEAERSGCDPDHVLQLVALCERHKDRFKDAGGELCNRIRQAYRGLDPYEGWSTGTLPRPKPPSFDELLGQQFSEEIRERNASGQGCDEEILRRWIDFHKLHGEAATASIQDRLHRYLRRLDERGVKGQERSELIDQFSTTCGLIAPVPNRRREKAVPR